MNRKQVLVIHGGDFFDTREAFFADLKKEELEMEDLLPEEKKGWKEHLASELGSDYEVFRPRMPLAVFARYEEWTVWFEKMFPYLRDGIVLIGHSLGGIFLARYLGENILPMKARALFLLAPYFSARKGNPDADSGWTIGSLEKLESQAEDIFIYQSEDDAIVPVSHAKEYTSRLPRAKLVMFKEMGHFRVERFPELTEGIKQLFDK
jgi:uncharacterized protein